MSKSGYIFGTGRFRPSHRRRHVLQWMERSGPIPRWWMLMDVVTRTALRYQHQSGAFLTNGIVKFGGQRFQPYIGAGAGGYFAETPGLNVNNGDFQTSGTVMLPDWPGRHSREPITILTTRPASSSNTNSWSIRAANSRIPIQYRIRATVDWRGHPLPLLRPMLEVISGRFAH